MQESGKSFIWNEVRQSNVRKKELPVGIVEGLSQRVQALLEDWAEEVGKECHVIKRQRKFTASTLAGTFRVRFPAKSQSVGRTARANGGGCWA